MSETGIAALAGESYEAAVAQVIAPFIGDAMRQNSQLRTFVGQGWYDFATPFFGAEMSLHKNGVVLDRVQFDYYDSGHMMYLAESDGKKLSDDVRAFIEAGQ